MTADAPVATPPAPPAPAAGRSGSASRTRATALVADRANLVIAGAALVGFVLRVLWANWVARRPLGLFDPARYLNYGRLLADGEGYVEGFTGEPTAYYPPGYPFFVGAVTWLSDHTPLSDDAVFAIGLVQALLGAATVVMAALVARRLVGRRAAVVTAVVMALYPNLVFHAGAVLGETLYNALFAAFLLVLVWRRWADGLSVPRLVLASAFLAGAVMVRPISLAVVPVLALAWWFQRRDLREVGRRLAVCLAVLALAVVPWTVRNLVRLDSPVIMSTNTGDNLCIGHAPGATGRFDFLEACDTGESVATGTDGELAHDRQLTRESIDHILDDPGREPVLVWWRFFYMFMRDDDGLWAVQSYGTDPFLDDRTELVLETAANAVYFAVLGFGLVGMARFARRRTPERLFVVLAAAATVAVPLAFFGDPRFKLPAIPLLVIAGSLAFADAARPSEEEDGVRRGGAGRRHGAGAEAPT